MSDLEDDRDGDESEVPDGAAVFPEIPEDLQVNPLLLAVIHSTIFLLGSSEEIVQPDAGEEAAEQIASYLQRLDGEALRQVKEDMACLVDFARREKWSRALIHALKTFLGNLGVAGAEADDEDDE